MKRLLAGAALAASVLASSATNAALFDTVYIVGANGSTTPVTQFSIDGPAPWLFVDLSGPLSEFTWLSASWFADGNPTAQFTNFPGNRSGADKLWFSPTPAEWNAEKAAGDWHVDLTLNALELILIYGVGVGQLVQVAGPTVSFNVVDPLAVPEPSTFALLGLSLLAFALVRVRQLAAR
jgi:hypothetical protein